MVIGKIPNLSVRWESDRLDPRAIGAALHNLWSDLHSRIESASELRANTVNLIAVVEDQERVRSITDDLNAQQGFAPSRVIMLMLERSASTGSFAIDVALEPLPFDRGRANAHYELIKVTAPPDQATSLASIASPLSGKEMRRCFMNRMLVFSGTKDTGRPGSSLGRFHLTQKAIISRLKV